MKIECIQNSPYYQSLTSTLSPYVKLFTEQVARIPHPSHIDRKLVASLAVPFCTAAVGLFIFRYFFQPKSPSLSPFTIDDALCAKLKGQMADWKTKYRFELEGYRYTITIVEQSASPCEFKNTPYISGGKQRSLFSAEAATLLFASCTYLVLRHKIADHPKLVDIKGHASEEAIRQIVRLFFSLGFNYFTENSFMWDPDKKLLVITAPPLNVQALDRCYFLKKGWGGILESVNEQQTQWVVLELMEINKAPPHPYQPGFLNELIAALQSAARK